VDAAVAGTFPQLRDAAGGQVSFLPNAMTDHTPTAASKSANLRTALVLLSIVALFFIGVIVNRVMFN
jgi:hypothetical protein